MLWRPRSSPPIRFVEPCQPSQCPVPPAGDGWLHEIKHDGYRLMVCRDGDRVALFTRNGHDWTHRFPAIVEASLALAPARFLIDGEVIVAGPDGRAVFDLLRRGPQTKPQALLCAFDLLLLANEDLRAHPLERRRQHLTQLLDAAGPGLVLNAQFAEAGGAAVFAQACALGLEGIVSKRKGSRYRSGRSLDWRKSKNPVSEAVRRETEEDWSREGRQGGGRNASRSRR